MAIGVPMLTTASSAVAGPVEDQIVVSVGPYMFSIRVGVTRPSSATSEPASGSPPIISRRTRPSAVRASSFMISIRAMLGVHCRCVTPWRTICAAIEKSSSATVVGAFARASTSASGRKAASTWAVGMP